MTAVRERIMQFGPGQGLAGILTTAARVGAGEPPHVVIVNAGVVHRVGPNRLYVDIARRVAAAGYPVLRFDLSGLGDSDSMPGGLSLAASAVQDIRTALDHLASARSAKRFLVFGLCSGANYALLSAFADPRVDGLLLIDPSSSRTLRSKLLHIVRRLQNPATLRELVLLRHPVFRRLKRLAGAAVSVAEAAEGQVGQRADRVPGGESATQVRRSLQQLLDRGAHLMMVFTGGINHVYNYERQLFDLLPEIDFRDQLRLIFMPGTDHTVSDGVGRAQLLDDLQVWLAHAFPVGGASPASSGPVPVSRADAGSDSVSSAR